MLRAAHVRISCITLAAISAGAVLSLLVPTAVAARPDPSMVKDIKTFVACLNMIKGKQRSIHNAVQCVPPCCNFVVTMSDKSAQAACELGGCKLPRVIFDCPGPAEGKRFRPSFLLCPLDSKSDGQFGTDRVEVGEDVDDKANMKMADVPAPPRATDFSKVTEAGVLSKVTDDGQGTKGCNGCHDAPNPAADADNNQLSEPIDPFGKFSRMELAPFVIDSDEPGHTVNPAMKMSLKDICKCIKKNKDQIKQAASDPNLPPEKINPNLDAKLLLKLCRKLKRKIPRTPCGTPRNTWTSTPTETPTHTPTPPPTHTPPGTPTDTPAPTFTATPTQTAAATSTVPDTPTVTPSQTAAQTPTNTPMVTPSPL